MKKQMLFFAVAGLIVAGLLAGQLFARAAYASLTLATTGNGDSVQVTAYGNGYSNVTLYYQKSGYQIQSRYIGSTDSNGYLSTVIQTSSSGISSGDLVYAVIGSVQTSSTTWPYALGYNNPYGSLTLSQTNVSLSVGQSVNITISGGAAPYTMYPSTTGIFQSAIGGSTIGINGLSAGSGTLNVCSSGGLGSGCSMLYVTVGQNNTNQQISLSQTAISLNSGNTAAVYIYGSGNYYISSHSNSGVASAYINGSNINVTAKNYGVDNITVCQNSGQCVTLYVTVANSGQTTGNVITFSRSNPVLAVGQSLTVSLYGGSGSNYYVAFNSSPSAVQTSVSGSTLTLTGNSYAGAGIVVCSSSNSCGALSVSVGLVAGAETGPNTWTYCAGENNQCYFPGTQLVRYGANGNYAYRTVSGSVMCSNSVFGDPIFGTVKQCSYGGTN